jgi:hypothetical protein
VTAGRLRYALVASCCAALTVSAAACGAARRVFTSDDGRHAAPSRAVASEESRRDFRPLRCVDGFGGVGSGAEPAALVEVAAPRKKAWEAQHGGELAARPYIRARMSGWPSALLAERESLPAGNDDFVRRMARDTWRGLAAFTDRPSGLPIDNVWLHGGYSHDPPALRLGDYTSTTNIGLYLTAIVAARDLGFIDPADARARAVEILDTLAGLERFKGFFFNFYDTTSLERTSNFISFVDAAWLLAGLVVLRNAVPELAERATRIIDAQDFGLFYDRKLGLISHGYWVHERRRSIFHYGVFYAESRLGALLAIGKGDVPASVWTKMMRVVPPLCGRTGPPVTAVVAKGASDDTAARSDEQASDAAALDFGVRRKGAAPAGYYEWDGERYVPSWGGSMFEALMPLLLVDEVRLAPRGLGGNALVHVRVQRRYAEQLGYPVWGLSPSASVEGPAYSEFGAAVLGARGYVDGIVTPHAAALALAAAPAEAIAVLRKMTELYDVYGDFGFYDALNPRSGRVAHAYLALDQAMILLAAANHLDGGRLRSYFSADPIVAPALPMLASEEFPLD